MTLEYEIGDGADALAHNQYLAALNGTYWIDGWDWSLGGGDYEVEIAAGSGLIELEEVETTSAQTIDFSGDVDTENPRKAVIYINENANVEYSLEDPAPAKPENEVRERTTVPNLPDLSGENVVVVAEVWIGADATEITSEDVRPRRVGNVALTPGVDIDANTLNGKTVSELTSPIFGNGSDGERVITGSAEENGVGNYERFEITQGGTLNVDGWTAIYAQNEIVIDGTIDGEGKGASGGSGGVQGDSDGSVGEDGVYAPLSLGGSGGEGGNGGDGGDGGDGDNRSTFKLYQALHEGIEFDLFEEAGGGGAGGGGGGRSNESSFTPNSGENGSSPGGGGGGGRTEGGDSVNGADGGNGGAFVALIAPTITITGNINCSASDGGDGNVSGNVISGAGGGGSGGVIFIKTTLLENSGSFDVSGGSGGSAGGTGGNGADGENGEIVIVEQA